jgi:hypothetical protein
MASIPIDREKYFAMLHHQLVDWHVIFLASQLLKLSNKQNKRGDKTYHGPG